MKQAQTHLEFRTGGKGFLDITNPVSSWVSRQDIATGILTLFIRHTSASLTIQENADPDVLRDLETFFTRAIPEDPSLYRHTMEGADDMPAHIRSALTDVQLNIPVANGHLVLGTWQGIFLWEHRSRPHVRTVVLHLIGEN